MAVCWQHKYTVEIKGISIQRSYDSVKNFSSIASVSFPRDIANGYIDPAPPYTKMFYRLFIAFDSGVYMFTPSQRPVVDNHFDMARAIQKVKDDNYVKDPANPKKDLPVYPSRRIYTNKDNTVVINIPEYENDTYSVKFFDDEYKAIYTVSRITDGYLTIERGNFKRSGWFFFELYKNEELLEKNRFYIAKD